MFEKRVIPGKTYCIFAPGPITVTAIMNNVEVKIVDATEVGKYFFTAPTTKIYSSINPNCIFEPDNSLNYNIGNTPNWLYSLKAALKILLGKSTDKITLDDNKFTIAVALDTTEEQIIDVKTFLNRVLPSNLVTEIRWANGLPIEYTPLEYLEGTYSDYKSPYIRTSFYPTQETRVRVTSESVYSPVGWLHCVFGCTKYPNEFNPLTLKQWYNNPKDSGFRATFGNQMHMQYPIADRKYTVEFSKNGVLLNGQLVATYEYEEFKAPSVFTLYSETRDGARTFGGRIYELQVWENDAPVYSFVPALDPTGDACMYDTVTHTPYYNQNPTYPFLYPGAEQAVMTLDLDLDAKSYAQLTEHGVRRLYHVPKGCTMSKDEYAAANRFKELVEPPMPMIGYWMPQWRETETQLILDWVETEPPIEENI